MPSRLLRLIVAVCLLSSCEKAEDPLVLPPPTGASHTSLDMGANYDKQIFYDFETGTQVSSDPMSWDLAFEASPDGRHVFMNGGKNVFVYNTHNQQMQQVSAVPASLTSTGAGWQFDAPCGLPDSTGIGEWYRTDGTTKGEVYIVQTTSGTYQKMRILAANAGGYTIEWMPLNATDAPATVQLVKDSAYNYIYFSFTGGIVKPEPQKTTWDVVFTRYRYIYRDLNNLPYEVTGVLLNPYQTSAAKDSTTAFSEISLQKAAAMPLSRNRDIIGFDWKTYNFSTARYEVNRAKNYILQTRRNHFYKMHFLDFYNASGVKGNPSFEYERLL